MQLFILFLPYIGPDDLLFKCFKEHFDGFDQQNLERWTWPAPCFIHDTAEETLYWAQRHLQLGTFPRTDYRELCELIAIFLGGVLRRCRQVVLIKPGAFHHARFMSKTLYILKIYLLEGQFRLTR